MVVFLSPMELLGMSMYKTQKDQGSDGYANHTMYASQIRGNNVRIVKQFMITNVDYLHMYHLPWYLFVLVLSICAR